MSATDRDTRQSLVPHAFLRLPTHPGSGAMVFDLSDEHQSLRFVEELRMSVSEGDPELTDDGEPWAVVEVRPMPAGYVDTLPEHGGW